MSLHKRYDRRSFLLQTALAGAGVALLSSVTPASAFHQQRQRLSSLATKRIGVIGLDTSHSEVFTRLINEGEFKGAYRVVAAYPHGSEERRVGKGCSCRWWLRGVRKVACDVVYRQVQ